MSKKSKTKIDDFNNALLNIEQKSNNGLEKVEEIEESEENTETNLEGFSSGNIDDFNNTLLNIEQNSNNNLEEVKEIEETEENTETDLAGFVAKNKWQVYKDLVNVFKERTKNDNNLKKTYSKILIGILISQLIIMNVVFILKGAKVLDFADTTFNLFITATIAEVFTLVTIIVKYLFTDKLTDLLSGILSDDEKVNKNDKN